MRRHWRTLILVAVAVSLTGCIVVSGHPSRHTHQHCHGHKKHRVCHTHPHGPGHH
jgi:hypothetical protein